MFHLSLVDHIRLSFGHVVYAYQAHAHAAERLARRAWQAKVATLALILLTAGACLLAVDGGRPFRIGAAVLAAAAFATHAGVLAFDVEPRVYAHRSCAARLWLLCEKYRALLAEIHDGLIGPEGVVERRDALIDEVHAVYAHVPPADRQAYQIARRTLTGQGEVALSEDELDRFLPESLRKTGKPATA
jgi:hypothetical protein